jgi:2-methylcitrate dehydratase PrpD
MYKEETRDMEAIAAKLAVFVEEAKFNDIPEHLVNEARLLLLDTIGCAIRGNSSECGRISVELARRLGGAAESTIIGTNDTVSCTNAAFANGQLMSALDYNPMCMMNDVPSVVAAVLALAEKKPTSGEELILSIIIGLEITKRIAYAAPLEGISASVFGAAASAGKILRLSREKMANAIGLAGYICPPERTVMKYTTTYPANMVKYGPMGWIAQIGVTSALLADMGFTGDTGVFETEWNYWKFVGKSEWDAASVLNDLGTNWQTHIEFKLYPGGI